MSWSLTRSLFDAQLVQIPPVLAGSLAHSNPEPSMPQLDGLRVIVGDATESEYPAEGDWTCLHYNFGLWTAKPGHPPQVEVCACSYPMGRSGPASIRWLIRDDWMAWLGRQCAGSEAALGQQRHGVFFLPSHLKAIVATIFDENARGAMHVMYRSAKCVELLCETLRLWVTDELVPMPSGSTVPLNEHARLVAARALIAENYRQKLTIMTISRACGLNRSKLTRGFKEVFKATVWEVLTGERLSWAARQLRGSDQSIASICFEAGYTNGASFTRAFTKRFGISPGKYRQRDDVPSHTQAMSKDT